MTAPVIRQFVGTIPDKGQSQTEFDTNVDAFLDWQALQFAPDLVAFGTFASNTAAALVSANLPSLTGNELDAVRVNAAADGVEFVDVTAAGWALLDDANAAAQRATLGLVIGTDVSAVLPAQTQTVWNTGTSTVESTITAAKLNAAAIAAVPIPIKAWVNFDGTGTLSINGNLNVSSVTDNGTGDYTINFATDLASSDYGVTASGSRYTFDLAAVAGVPSGGTKTVSAVRIVVDNGAGNKVNSDDMTVIVVI